MQQSAAKTSSAIVTQTIEVSWLATESAVCGTAVLQPACLQVHDMFNMLQLTCRTFLKRNLLRSGFMVGFGLVFIPCHYAL